VKFLSQRGAEKKTAEDYIDLMTKRILLEAYCNKISSASKFYEAEDYHQIIIMIIKLKVIVRYIITPK
jgi:peptide-methionine (S)-S-oxide reductase